MVDNEEEQTPTRMGIHKDEEEEQTTTSINLKRRFISSVNRFKSSIKMKKSIVAERVQSFLAIHGGGGVSAMVINNSSIHDHYELGGVDLSVVSDRKISICFQRSTRNAFCCKSVNKNNRRNNILDEINVMSRVSDHRGIVKLHEVYEDEDSEMIHLVMDLCSGGDLLKAVMHRESYKDHELEAAVIFRQIMESIQYCHDRGVVHRDVKLENIFLEGSCMPPVVKLGDFGLATLIQKGQLLYNQTGTLVYVAPEIFDCQGYAESVDIWSAGVLLYRMLSGRFPFDGDFFQLKRKVLNEDVDLKSGAWKKISEAAKDLISGMLIKAPEFRLKATQVLRHPWLNHEKCQKGPIA